MVRDTQLLSCPEAVRRATLLPAETMGLKKKGRLRPGMDADLVVFDPQTVAERACFITAPDAPPVGIHRVIIGGKTAALDNEIIDSRLGKVIPFGAK